jgi:FkbM family methyltransferase
MSWVRRLAQTPPARAILTLPPIERAVAACIRGSALAEPVRFVLGELSGRRRVGRYRLRGSDLWIFVRHGTPDVFTLEQTFRERHFDPPAPVQRLLAGIVDPVVVDLGANIGLFGIEVLRRYRRARIVAFEPDPANVEILRKTVAANEPGGRWQVIEAAASTSDGTVAFTPGQYGISHLAAPGSGAATRVRAIDVFPYLNDADLVKIDIEGGEWELVGDGRFSATSARILHFEYHPRFCPGPEPRRSAVEALSRAGYSYLPIIDRPDGTGMLWAWREGTSSR